MVATMNILTISTTTKLTPSATLRRRLSAYSERAATSLRLPTTATTTFSLRSHHHNLPITGLYTPRRHITNPKPQATHVSDVTEQPELEEEERKTTDVEDDGAVKSALELQQRWDFIKKVYGILSAQVVFTAVVSSVVAVNKPFVDAITSHSFTLFLLTLACDLSLPLPPSLSLLVFFFFFFLVPFCMQNLETVDLYFVTYERTDCNNVAMDL